MQPSLPKIWVKLIKPVLTVTFQLVWRFYENVSRILQLQFAIQVIWEMASNLDQIDLDERLRNHKI